LRNAERIGSVADPAVGVDDRVVEGGIVVGTARDELDHLEVQMRAGHTGVPAKANLLALNHRLTRCYAFARPLMSRVIRLDWRASYPFFG
jgi:hypothetical protein